MIDLHRYIWWFFLAHCTPWDVHLSVLLPFIYILYLFHFFVLRMVVEYRLTFSKPWDVANTRYAWGPGPQVSMRAIGSIPTGGFPKVLQAGWVLWPSYGKKGSRVRRHVSGGLWAWSCDIVTIVVVLVHSCLQNYILYFVYLFVYVMIIYTYWYIYIYICSTYLLVLEDMAIPKNLDRAQKWTSF